MTLTGKAKEEFEKWFANELERTEQKLTELGRVHVVDEFYTRITESMQWGVYQDWADSLGHRLDVTVFYDQMLGYVRGYEVKVNDKDIYRGGDVFETREEARDAAVEKLNELINDQ